MQGVAANATQWGAWASAGMAAADRALQARLERVGMGSIPPQQVCKHLTCCTPCGLSSKCCCWSCLTSSHIRSLDCGSRVRSIRLRALHPVQQHAVLTFSCGAGHRQPGSYTAAPGCICSPVGAEHGSRAAVGQAAGAGAPGAALLPGVCACCRWVRASMSSLSCRP